MKAAGSMARVRALSLAAFVVLASIVPGCGGSGGGSPGAGPAPVAAVQLSLIAGTIAGPGYVDGAGTLARFDSPTGIAFDQGGNLYVADSLNHVIRKVSRAGTVTTF